MKTYKSLFTLSILALAGFGTLSAQASTAPSCEQAIVNVQNTATNNTKKLDSGAAALTAAMASGNQHSVDAANTVMLRLEDESLDATRAAISAIYSSCAPSNEASCTTAVVAVKNTASNGAKKLGADALVIEAAIKVGDQALTDAANAAFEADADAHLSAIKAAKSAAFSACGQ